MSAANSSTPVFYTIGYEGLGIDKFLDRLSKYEVKTLVDIRNNPLSRNASYQLDRCCP
ncbi:MAG: DUF488 domain-containing protein [Thaumarchaeota archaeon]|nr:MAG: DUF488 domain-containing protein [Nitrososphaerota archaeon]